VTYFEIIGLVVAGAISIALNHSFGWALLHIFFGWFYVLYAIATRSKEIIPALRNLF
jgi:hypothetical protein